MSLIKCPECSHEISDKAEICPYCGCPKKFFNIPKGKGAENPEEAITDYETIRKMLHDFSDEWRSLFGQKKYIARSEANKFYDSYSKYIGILNNPYTHEYIRNNGGIIGFEARQSQVFLNRMAGFIKSVDGHNEKYVNEKLIENKEYFDEILKPVDSAVLLDEDQRRAVITDEDYCLLVAGAGAGKTTTMAAKVKYLVDKQGISPSDIIVISYTNKNYGLPLYMCTNDPEICDFMTNSPTCLADIFKCPDCKDGYQIVKYSKKNDSYFYGCTNWDADPQCKHTEKIQHS